MRRLPYPLGISLVLGLLSSSVCQAAEPSAKERAKQLFDEGIQAIEKRNRDVGCAKLRESLTLFAVPNTLFNVAECDEHDGNFALAFTHWNRGLALIPSNDPRARVAKKQIANAETKIARITFVAPPTLGNATVLLDKEELPLEALKEAWVVNAGKLVVVTRLPGHEDDRREIELAPGDRTEVILRAGKPIGPIDGSETKEPGSKWKTASFVAFGLSMSGAIAAGITGGLLLARDGEIQKHCKERLCDQSGVDLARGQSPLLTGNAIAWGVGAAGLGTGVVFFLLYKRTPKNDSAYWMPTVTKNFVGFDFVEKF